MKNKILSLLVSILLVSTLSSCADIQNDTPDDLVGQTWSLGNRDEHNKLIEDDTFEFETKIVFLARQSVDGFYPDYFSVGDWTNSDGQSYRLFYDRSRLVCVIPLGTIKELGDIENEDNRKD